MSKLNIFPKTSPAHVSLAAKWGANYRLLLVLRRKCRLFGRTLVSWRPPPPPAGRRRLPRFHSACVIVGTQTAARKVGFRLYSMWRETDWMLGKQFKLKPLRSRTHRCSKSHENKTANEFQWNVTRKELHNYINKHLTRFVFAFHSYIF